ncbi:hypothetical protein VTK26DRAFT_539 [Humicola hyalothermophila]
MVRGATNFSTSLEYDHTLRNTLEHYSVPLIESRDRVRDPIVLPSISCGIPVLETGSFNDMLLQGAATLASGAFWESRNQGCQALPRATRLASVTRQRRAAPATLSKLEDLMNSPDGERGKIHYCIRFGWMRDSTQRTETNHEIPEWPWRKQTGCCLKMLTMRSRRIRIAWYRERGNRCQGGIPSSVPKEAGMRRRRFVSEIQIPTNIQPPPKR